jgi:hypothetical protein
MFITDPDLAFLPILDAGVQKAPDPDSRIVIRNTAGDHKYINADTWQFASLIKLRVLGRFERQKPAISPPGKA